MSTAPTPPPSRGSSTGTVERLYVLWIVSSLMLVLLIVIVALLGSGQLRHHAERISQQSTAIAQLRSDMSKARQELANLKAGIPDRAQAPQAPRVPAEEPGESASPVEGEVAEPPAAPLATMAAGDIEALLQKAVRPGEDGLYEVVDRTAAAEALQAGLAGVGHASWSGETWARLAALACLLDHDTQAEMFAASARVANEFPGAYYEISARKLLTQQRPREALVFARLLAAGRPTDPRGALLLAEAYRLTGDLAAADVALEDLGDAEHLSLADKLRLGRLFAALEHWDRLDALLASVGEVPQAALPQLNYLRALLAIQQGRLPEALAILNNLLAEHPDDYELRTWRGVALLYARQFQAAREALAHAEEHPERPEAWYWRGMLELEAGNIDDAIPLLEHAVAASHSFAPAWEALGTIALNQGDVSTALENLTKAVNANPRRATTYFLIALAQAKASRPVETADALRTAFRLDSTFLETAKQAEAIRRMFSEDELAALAEGAAVVPSRAPTTPDKAEPE
jgi:tetratricopeptide (TPR) repeat protein